MATTTISTQVLPTPVRPITAATLVIPAPVATALSLRFARLADRDNFGKKWQTANLDSTGDGYFQIDLNALRLPDGTYEYDLQMNTVSGRPREPIPARFGEVRRISRQFHGD